MKSERHSERPVDSLSIRPLLPRTLPTAMHATDECRKESIPVLTNLPYKLNHFERWYHVSRDEGLLPFNGSVWVPT